MKRGGWELVLYLGLPILALAVSLWSLGFTMGVSWRLR